LLLWAIPASAGIKNPECVALASWAKSFAPPAGTEAIPGLFGAKAFVEMFGKPIEQWDSRDFQALDQQMKDCQRQLFKQDRQAANQINTVRRHVPEVRRAVEHQRSQVQDSSPELRQRGESASEQTGGHTAEPPRASEAKGAKDTVASSAGASGAGISPTCEDFRAWVESADVEGNFEPLPNITLSRLFDDDSLVPFWGRSAVSLKRDDFGELRAQVYECRKQAAAQRRRAEQATFDTALTSIKEASRSMRTAWTAQIVAERGVDSLLERVPTPIANDPTFSAVLEIAVKSLQGSDVNADVAALDRQLQGFGRNAAELANHRPYLSEAEIDEYVKRLRERRQTLQAEAVAGDEDLDQLQRQIASVPVSQAGLAQLRQLHHQTDTSSMTRENAAAYNQAFQLRWRYISNAIQRQQEQAKQALASSPVPVDKLFARVVEGEIGPLMTVASVKVGTTPAEAASSLSSRMGYGEAVSFETGKQYTVKGKDLKRYTEQEGRDGGVVNLQTKHGIVGEIEYIEHFTGPIDLASAKQVVIDRFGSPEEENRRGSYTEVTWSQDDHLLKVAFGPRINGVARFSGNWRSSVRVVLRSKEFAEYLEEASERCERLRAKPASELSINDKKAILTGCRTP